MPRLLLLIAGFMALTLAAQLVRGNDQYPTLGEVVSLDPDLEQVIDPLASIEVLASGFGWSEGPLWMDEQDGPGYLLFSDVPKNHILKWSQQGGLSVYMQPSGYTGVAPYGGLSGSNGLLLDNQGRLICCEHGDRRISCLTQDGGKRTLADNYQGRRFHSPNDAVMKSNGDIYFTDPDYGLPQREQDPRRELDFWGVFRVTPQGEVSLMTRELTRPNGIGFSPDEKTLYVTTTGPEFHGWMAFPVLEDGTLGSGRKFFDGGEGVRQKRPGSFDGLKVDRSGNLWATGPGGVHIITPDGRLLGRISTGTGIGNCTFGGTDRSVLYLCSHKYLCRIPTRSAGH